MTESTLAEIVIKHAKAPANAVHCLILIREAIARFRTPLPPLPDVSRKAKSLGDSAAEFASQLRLCCDLKSDGDGLGRFGPDNVWPILRIAELMGENGLGDDLPFAIRFGGASRSARMFDQQAGNPWLLFFAAKQIEKNAKLAAAFSKPGRPKSLPVARLSFELRDIWTHIKGRKPGRVKESSYDNPRGYFDHFVKAALEESDLEIADRRAVFNATKEGGKIVQTG
jgi:hypothetical protein